MVGSGHSWSDVVVTDDNMVNIDALDRVIGIDKGNQRITVEAGIRLQALNEVLAENGLALANLGAISEQSVAGAISTATHGTGIRLGNMATQIVGMTLLTADGRRLALTQEKDPETMSAARVSLGCLGAISQVTIQCVD